MVKKPKGTSERGVIYVIGYIERKSRVGSISKIWMEARNALAAVIPLTSRISDIAVWMVTSPESATSSEVTLSISGNMPSLSDTRYASSCESGAVSRSADRRQRAG